MKAMVLEGPCRLEDNPTPLKLMVLPDPVPAEGEILVKITACGVCHTELDEIEGRTPPPRFPIVPGHQVVGRVAASGPNACAFANGDPGPHSESATNVHSLWQWAQKGPRQSG